MSGAELGREARTVSPGWVMTVCAGSTFIAFLDFSVVNIAFPEISHSFARISINSLTWIVSGYAVAFAALLAPGGRIADAIGRKGVFLWSLVVFTLASLVCGLAPSVGWLIAARFVQGAASGGMVPSALGLILATTPRERIGHAVSIWTTAAGFSAVIGPAVGGVLLHIFSWRAVFLINLPFGAAMLAGGLVVLPAHVKGAADRLPDFTGSLALGLGVAGVVSALTEGDSWGWLDARTIGLAVAGLVLVAVSVLRSRTHQAPAIDLAVWRSRAFQIANLGLSMLSAVMFAWMLGAPLFAAAVWHWPVLDTAAALCVGGAASMAGALAAGRFKTATVRVRAGVAGSLMFAGSNAIWASSLFGPRPDFLAAWLPAAILGGGGLGLALTSLSTIAAGTITPLKFAGGLGMITSVRQVGGAIGVAGVATILASNAVPESISSFHEVFIAAMAVNICCAVIVSSLIVVLRPSRQPSAQVYAEG